jgi:hypothetical protein
MTKTSEKPRRPRVQFEGDVLIRGARREAPIRARARNLSASGIAVTLEDPPEPGEKVECRLMIAGQRRNLSGRVAWARRPTPGARSPAGAGIEFTDLAAPDQALLARIVEGADDGAEPVDVWVEGLTHPVRMRGLVHTEEIKLGLQLPPLREGVPLRLRFAHRGVSEEREGRIIAVKLLSKDEEVGTRVVLHVTTARPSSVQGTISARDDKSQVQRPLREARESMVVNVAAISPPAPAARRVPAAPVPAQTPAAPPAAPAAPRLSQSLRVWQVATGAALIVGVLLGLLIGGASDWPAPAPITRPAPRPSAPRITIQPLTRPAQR